MPKTATLPTTIRTSRELQRHDAIDGTTYVPDAARTPSSILDRLEARATTSPVAGREYETLESFVEAAVLISRDVLDTIECGAEQARDRLRELQAAEVTQ